MRLMPAMPYQLQRLVQQLSRALRIVAYLLLRRFELQSNARISLSQRVMQITRNAGALLRHGPVSRVPNVVPCTDGYQDENRARRAEHEYVRPAPPRRRFDQLDVFGPPELQGKWVAAARILVAIHNQNTRQLKGTVRLHRLSREMIRNVAWQNGGEALMPSTHIQPHARKTRRLKIRQLGSGLHK